MRKYRFSYFAKEGITSIFNHGFMSFASVCIIIACLLIMGSFTLLALNVSSMIQTLEDENQVVAFVDESYTEEQARGLATQIAQVDNISSISFVTRDQAMETFTEQYDSNLFEGLDSSVLRDRYIVYLRDIEQIETTQMALANIPGIAKVNAHTDIAEGFTSLSRMVTIVSVSLVVVLFVISLFIMSNTIKLTTFERREEIGIMKMVGATSSFIRWPFVFEGLILGLIGSLTAYLMQWGLYQLVLRGLGESMSISFINFLPFSVFAVPMLVIFLVIGLGVGVIGSLVAIKNYLKV